MMNDKEYRALDALSGSVLSELARSPAHYKHRIDNPKEPTDAMVFGSLLHCMLLEPEEVSKRYYHSSYEGVRRGKAWEAELAKAGTRVTIKHDVWEEAQTMIKKCLGDKTVSLILENASFEQVFTWEEDGVQCKGKLDIVKPGLIVDYKTTNDADPSKFKYKVLDYGYLLQLAHYQAAVKESLGLDAYPGCLVIAQESSAPYVVQVYSVGQRLIDEAHAKRKELLRVYKECTLTGNWDKGYNTGILEIE